MPTTSTCQGMITKTINRITSTTSSAQALLDKQIDGTVLTQQEIAKFEAYLVILTQSAKIIHSYMDKWSEVIEDMEQTDESKAEDLTKKQDEFYTQKDPLEHALNAETNATAMKTELYAMRPSLSSNQFGSAESQSNNASTTASQFPTLAPIQLEHFDGNRSKWNAFKDQFLALVDSRPMDDVYKLLQLKAALVGSPKELISEFPSTKDNYTIAWKRLTDHYEQPHEQEIALMQELLELKPAKSTEETRKVINTLSRITMQFKNLKSDEPTLNLRHAFITKLPPWLSRQATDAKPKGTPKELLEEADKIFSKNEFYDHFHKMALDSNSKSKDSLSQDQITLKQQEDFGFNSKKATPNFKSLCAFCSGNHFHAKCPDYTTSEARTNRALKLSLCFKCLSSDHKARDCSKGSNCLHCKASDHHSLLCNFKVRNVIPTLNTMTVTSFNNSTGNENNLLMTKSIDIISSTNNNHSVFALIDFGSQSSFIKKATAQKLGLKLGLKSSMQFGGFNSKPKVCKSQKTSVKVRTKDNQHFTAELQTIGQIVGPIRTLVDHPKTLDELKSFNCHDNTCFKEPEILIGIDMIAHLGLQTKDSLQCGLLCFDSNIGFILCGKLNSTKCQVSSTPSLNKNQQPIEKLSSDFDKNCMISTHTSHHLFSGSRRGYCKQQQQTKSSLPKTISPVQLKHWNHAQQNLLDSSHHSKTVLPVRAKYRKSVWYPSSRQQKSFSSQLNDKLTFTSTDNFGSKPIDSSP